MSSEDCRFGDLRVRLIELAIAATLLRAHGSHFSGLLLASADAVRSLFRLLFLRVYRLSIPVGEGEEREGLMIISVFRASSVGPSKLS